MMTLSKNQLKHLATYRQQKNCDIDGLFVVEGEKLCLEALRSNFSIVTVCALSSWFKQYEGSLPVNCQLYEVDDDALSRLSQLKTPNKVWMLLRRQQEVSSPEIRQGLTLALDGLQDPGNLGTIIRTADWYDIRHIVCSRETVSCYNPKVVQATMGSIFRIIIDYVDLPIYLKQCKAKNCTIYGATLDGENIYCHTLNTPSVLVIGNEAHGISTPVAAELTSRITIPNLGGTCESLNASIATAILCSEFARKDAEVLKR